MLDWSIVGMSLLIAIGIGLYFTKKATASKDDYLLAGRNLGWFVAGTSIVATTFSSDTPLFVARITRETGIFENWWWWAGAIGQLASVFFFARLWRRSEVTTDVEFVSKRYGDNGPSIALRLIRAGFDGIFVNSMVVASVTLGMVKILSTILGMDNHAVLTIPIGDGIGLSGPVLILITISASTLLYTTMSGLYGVVYTDVFQFILAMAGCIALAVIVYIDASKGAGLHANLEAAKGFKPDLLNFFPKFEALDLTAFAFLVYIGMIWWSSVPGGSYYVQRMLATKNENEAAKAFLWFNVCQYVLRPWPWIIVGLASMIYFPELMGADSEKAYPAMIAKFLPVGLKGMMVAALLAAYMSTVSTHLHLGVSYLVNDVYQPYLVKNRSQHHYVRVSQFGMLALTVVAGIMCLQLESITGVYKFLGVYWAGMGTILIVRWYWWRINAWAELTALLSSIFLVLFLHTGIVTQWLSRLCLKLGFIKEGAKDPDFMTPRIVITMVLVTLVWIIVAYLTSERTPSEQTIAFYRKLRVAGPGWNRVAKLSDIQPLRGEIGRDFLAWGVSIVWLYSLLLSIGYLLFLEWTKGFSLLAISVFTGYVLYNLMVNGKILVDRHHHE